MRRVLLGLILLLGLSAPSFAASTPDPCVSASFKQSVVINMSSATTTQLVAAVTGKSIFVCGFAMSIAGSASTAATAALEGGTGSNCASTVTTLTGTFGSNDAAVSTTPTVVNYGNGGATIAVAPISDALCVVTTGNAVLTQGIVTYVQSTGNSYP